MWGHKLLVAWALPHLTSRKSCSHTHLFCIPSQGFSKQRHCLQSKHYIYNYGGWLSETGCLFRLCVCLFYIFFCQTKFIFRSEMTISQKFATSLWQSNAWVLVISLQVFDLYVNKGRYGGFIVNALISGLSGFVSKPGTLGCVPASSLMHSSLDRLGLCPSQGHWVVFLLHR